MDSLGYYNYWLTIAIIMIGFYGVIAKRNLVKQIIALGLFQTGVFLFYVSMGVFRKDGEDGQPPIWSPLTDENGRTVIDQAGYAVKELGVHDNPLPHVLMLTAIVVSVSTLAVAAAIVVNIKRRYQTIEEDEILAIEHSEAAGVTDPAGADPKGQIEGQTEGQTKSRIHIEDATEPEAED